MSERNDDEQAERGDIDGHGETGRAGAESVGPAGPGPVPGGHDTSAGESFPGPHEGGADAAAGAADRGDGRSGEDGSTSDSPPAPIGSASAQRRHGPGWPGVVVVAVAAAVASGLLTFGAVKATDSNPGIDSGEASSASSAGPSASATSAPPVTAGSARNPDWQKVAAAVSPSTVAIMVTSGQKGGEGTGIILNTKGDILTNNHVATGAGANAQIVVTTTGGTSYEATIVGADPATDLAVLRLADPPKDLQPAALGDSSAVAAGQRVMAVGTPLGLSDTVTTGIVSATHRPVQTKQSTSSAGVTSDTVAITSAIQTDAPINPGNSGGPLVNANGQVIGINSSIASLSSTSAGGSSQAGSIGLGFAIPINLAENISSQLIKGGAAQHAFLGVSLQDGVGASSASSRTRGGEVVSVVDGSPAQSAGLQKGDVITKVGGVSVGGAAGVTAEIRSYPAGTKVDITVLRDTTRKQLTATLAAK